MTYVVCALKITYFRFSFDDFPYLLVATVDGWLNIYMIEENGGDCSLINKYKCVCSKFMQFDILFANIISCAKYPI